MKIESIRLKNFKAFKNVEIKNIPQMCVFVGANGTGKTTLFNVFSFLKYALTDNVNVALTKLGGGRGFKEVRSRNSTGPIEIELKFRIPLPQGDKSPLVTYSLTINEEDDRPIIEKEILQYRRGSKGQPWRFLDFSKGKGQAVINEPDQVIDEKELKREEHELKSPDILALKGLAQFEKFPASKAIGDLLENWHISDFHIQQARIERELSYAEHLSKEGENLAMVTEFLYRKHKDIFQKILEKLKQRVPGISQVDAKITEEGRVLLRFKDGDFHDPFLARYVSDGTIKMFAYLVLLYDPQPHPLLCVEEPENQLYPKLLYELAEEFREYARKGKGGQVFISTHSPDFLNGCELQEVFWLQKERGYTIVKRASDDEQITNYMKEGDQLGYLWRQGFFAGADPL
ncbi:AAA family ATPase [Anabaena sp. FACHB-1237]|uniref:AAA family ATPase n=1 Tax=Anabaena sp. FACHB-1237 TaxID=2692769 RepID=UPI0016819BA1|nr:AAA family ATPase [Anabaena sp. FACHB-1237]MBD2139128.1 AAA family ATPase [Anabaena sp. FACHB-1237]